MPPEWHSHESTWLAWPKDPLTWPNRVAAVQEVFLRVIALLARNEHIDLLVDNKTTRNHVEERLRAYLVSRGSVRFHEVATVDSWIRDYGPNFLLRRLNSTAEIAYNNWKFNAWGQKYQELMADNGIARRIPALREVRFFQPGMVLEGGSIDVNGDGSLLTTEQCLLNLNRNPGLSRAAIEKMLCDYLGVVNVIWLEKGVAGDDTDGHVDDIARFVSNNTVVCAIEEDPQDENYAPLQDCLRRLQLATNRRGAQFTVVTLPMPGRVEGDGQRLPASYANFYIANQIVLVPVFGHRNDQKAVDILQSLFPTRVVLGVHCEPLVWGMGTLHCVTQQQPAAVAR
ncbi:MAG: agmatine deiminase family protein [Acidobacteria bacterium]|nr:agmatine deiminase family protein [Acidobacteriota bacterium]